MRPAGAVTGLPLRRPVPALRRLARVWRGSDLARADRPTLAIFAAALLVGLAARLFVSPDRPLWLDEAWTLGVAGLPDWKATVAQVWLDANAPLYPLLIHLWAGLAGTSDAALRCPSLVFSLAAPLLVAGWRVDGLRVEERLAVATLLAVWIEGILQAQEARCYALLLLLATAQTLAFLQLLRRPDLGRAALWTGLAGAVVLTHYQAAALGLCQGLAYLATHRMRAMRTWPAALALAPALAVGLWHAPRLALFARPDVAWYPPVTWDTVTDVLRYVTGAGALYALPVAGLGMAGWRLARGRGAAAGPAAPWLAALTAVAAAALLLTVGALRPSFSLRYVTPCVPGIALGLALSARGLAPVFPGAVTGLMLMAGALSANWSMDVAGRLRHPYTFEAASRDLAATRPAHLVFLWDHPAQQVEQPSQYVMFGGAFLRRSGSTAEVIPVMVRPGEDPNLRLVQSARKPDSVILWLYDTHVRGTAAARFPPRIPALDASFGCRNYARGAIGVIACARSWAGKGWAGAKTP